MAPTSWKLPIPTGHQEMDEQHRTLAETLGRLNALVAQGRGGDELEGLLVFFRDFLVQHLELEEELMARCHYPGERAHRDLHIALSREIESFLDAFRQGHGHLSQANLEYLEDWLRQHIQNEDLPFAEFLTRLQPPN